MQVARNDIVRGASIGLVCVAGASIVTIPFLVWGGDHTPEFFGAFTAAIVAAIAVVLGAFYQSELTRQRDDELRKREQVGEIVELYFWLGHASREMDFIAGVLERMHARLIETAQSQLSLPIEQFREIVTSQFMNELLLRAKAAAKLPFDVANPIVHALYGAYTETDRLYRLRGAKPDYRPSADEIAKYAKLARARTKSLEGCIAEVEVFICTTKHVGRFMEG